MKKNLITLLYILFVVVLNAQVKTDSLSLARYNIPIATFKNYTVMGSSAGSAWDVFNNSNRQHTSGNFTISRTDIKFIQSGTNAYYAGGKYGYFADPQYTRNIDVFNAATGTWSVLNLSLQRIVGGAGALGNYVYFAGGIGRQDISGPVYLYNRVDIFDVRTNARTLAKLSRARDNIAVGAAAGKIVFAGGWFWDMSYNQVQSNAVDIYDSNTGIWSKTLLSARREGIGVAVIGNKILFAGGSSYFTTTKLYKNVDIYDAAANTWTTTYMSYGRANMGVAVYGSKAYFAGGDGPDNIVDVYDAVANSWSTITMPVALKGFSVCAGSAKIYFSGGYDANNSVSSLVQVYDVTTGVWSSFSLSQARCNISSAASNGNIVFAGGLTNPLSAASVSNRIDIYKESILVLSNSKVTTIKENNWNIYPNPAKGFVYVNTTSTANNNATLIIYDLQGHIIFSQKTIPSVLDLSMLASGTYLIKIEDGNTCFVQKIDLLK